MSKVIFQCLEGVWFCVCVLDWIVERLKLSLSNPLNPLSKYINIASLSKCLIAAVRNTQ